jgi:L-seryl-tRNA(Ser) seleniumtransferase
LVTYDPARIKTTGREVMAKMREGRPRIEINPGTGGAPASAGLPGGENTVIIGVWMLQAGEDLIVGKRLREVLLGAAV